MDNTFETARRNSLSQRQRDTESLMRHLTWLAEAKATGNDRLVWEALDDIAAAALDCDTHSVRLRYMAALSAHRAEYRSAGCTERYRSLDVFWHLPEAAEAPQPTTGADDQDTSFNLDDFGGDLRAMEGAIRAWLRSANPGSVS